MASRNASSVWKHSPVFTRWRITCAPFIRISTRLTCSSARIANVFSKWNIISIVTSKAITCGRLRRRKRGLRTDRGRVELTVTKFSRKNLSVSIVLTAINFWRVGTVSTITFGLDMSSLTTRKDFFVIFVEKVKREIVSKFGFDWKFVADFPLKYYLLRHIRATHLKTLSYKKK